MTKHVRIPIAPREHKRSIKHPAEGQQAADHFVQKTHHLTRFTIDLPVELHRAVKVYCAERGLRMNGLIRGLLEKTVYKHE